MQVKTLIIYISSCLVGAIFATINMHGKVSINYSDLLGYIINAYAYITLITALSALPVLVYIGLLSSLSLYAYVLINIIYIGGFYYIEKMFFFPTSGSGDVLRFGCYATILVSVLITLTIRVRNQFF